MQRDITNKMTSSRLERGPKYRKSIFAARWGSNLQDPPVLAVNRALLGMSVGLALEVQKPSFGSDRPAVSKVPAGPQLCDVLLVSLVSALS